MWVIGEWTVRPELDRLEKGAETRHIAPRATDVLVYMAERQGELVTKEELLDAFWRGAISGDNAVHKTVAGLRRAFDDDPTQPSYIQTHPKRGYRLIAPARMSEVAPRANPTPSAHIIGVLPFVALDDGESELRSFGLGLAEELVSSLGESGFVQVLARTVTFGIATPYGDPASLGSRVGCTHLLEGSVRRHEKQVRVTARLVDCEAGQPRWSRTLDRFVDNPIDCQAGMAEALGLAVAEHLGAVESEPFAPTPDQSYLKHLFDESESVSDEAPG